MYNQNNLDSPQSFNNQSNLEGLVSNFMASQDARLTKFEADFKQQQSTLPNDTKNPKLSTYPVLSARSYPTEDPQGSTIVHGSINTVTICPKQPNPKDTNTMAHNKEQRDTPQLELKDTIAVNNLGPDSIDEGIKWLDIEETLDLIDTSEESVYESPIQEMPKCSLNYDFRIKKGDPRNLKIPCMIGHRFTANAYIDIDLPMNIVSLAYYNFIRKNGYEYMGRNFVGLERGMHVFVGNMSYVMDFTILESIETNIDPSLSNVVFGRPFVEIACLAINRK
ncbi:hypothetical protein Tco_0869133 [Tanacetum coccineum]